MRFSRLAPPRLTTSRSSPRALRAEALILVATTRAQELRQSPSPSQSRKAPTCLTSGRLRHQVRTRGHQPEPLSVEPEYCSNLLWDRVLCENSEELLGLWDRGIGFDFCFLGGYDWIMLWGTRYFMFVKRELPGLLIVLHQGHYFFSFLFDFLFRFSFLWFYGFS